MKMVVRCGVFFFLSFFFGGVVWCVVLPYYVMVVMEIHGDSNHDYGDERDSNDNSHDPSVPLLFMNGVTLTAFATPVAFVYVFSRFRLFKKNFPSSFV